MAQSTMIGDRKNGLKDGLSNEWFATFDLYSPAKARNQDASVVIDRPKLQDILLGAMGDCVRTGVRARALPLSSSLWLDWKSHRLSPDRRR